MLRIGSIMTKDVATLSPEATLRDAMELLTQRRISGAAVVSGGVILGVISTSDLTAFASTLPVSAAWPRGLRDPLESDALPPAAEFDELERPEIGPILEMWDDAVRDVAEEMAAVEARTLDQLEQYVVRDVMSTDVVTMRSDTPVKKAADVMRRRRIHRVLVVDGGELVGILSTLDIANAVADGRLTTRTYLFNHHARAAGGW